MRIMNRRAALLVGAASIAGLVLAGCAGPAEPAPEPTESGWDGPVDSVTLMLNGPAAGSSVGFIYAEALGFYDEVGLDVTIEESGGSAIAAAALAAGQVDFAYADGPTTMLTRSKDADIKIVSVVFQSNGFSMISLADNDITDVKDLAGKRIGVAPGTAQTSLFNAVLEQNDLVDKVELVNVDISALAPSLLQGEIDVMLGAAVADSVNLRNQGTEVNDILFSDAGVPTLGLSMSASEALIEENPELVMRFVTASLRGWDAARDDPVAAAAAVFEAFPTGFDLATLEAQTQIVTSSLLCIADSKGVGNPPQSLLDITFDLLTKYQDLPAEPAVGDYFDLTMLPPVTPSC